MSKLVFAVCVLFGTSGFAAASFDLQMEVGVDGKTVSSTQLLVMEGEAGSISTETGTDKTTIEVVAKETTIKKNKGILMSFVVNYTGKDGKRSLIAKPQILAKENERAQISIGDKKETMTLTVTAKRKAL